MFITTIRFFNDLSTLSIFIAFFAIVLFVIILKLFDSRNRIVVVLSLFSFIAIIIGIVSIFYFSNNTAYAKNAVGILSENISFRREINEGEIELISFHLAYSNRISEPEYINGKLGFYMDGTNWFYWADGRILPESKLKDKDKFTPHFFSIYPEKLLPILEKSDVSYDYIQLKHNGRKGSTRDNTFLDVLYGGSSSRSMYENIKRISVLGYKTEANIIAVEPLKLIDKEVKELASTNVDVANFLSSLQMLSGYAWRNISKSSNRSYHSYGLAFDLLPKTTKGKQVYWNWSRVNNKHWYSIPHSNRWMPPDEIIAIFEAHGFIWGGKWQFFDTMHFEYRPEIVIYNRLVSDEVLLNNFIKLL